MCSSLAAWNGKADLDSGIGLVHFQNLFTALAEHPESWRVAFDPADPQHTPRGLAVEQAAVRKRVRDAALASLKQVNDSGVAEGTRWGQVQQALDGTPVPVVRRLWACTTRCTVCRTGRASGWWSAVPATCNWSASPTKGQRLVGYWHSPSRAKRLQPMPVTRPSICGQATGGDSVYRGADQGRPGVPGSGDQ